MIHKLGVLCLVVLCVYSAGSVKQHIQISSNSPQLPPIETLFFEPIEPENFVVWVPAAKVGPEINSSCQAERNCSYSAILSADVAHTKTESCLKEVARLLARKTASHHQGSFPLTMLDGWRWEYSYDACQFESVYDLLAYGGSFEGAWEAILTHSKASVDFQLAQILPPDKVIDEPSAPMQGSSVEVRTFSVMRTRDGYPKRRQFYQR